MKVLLSAPKLTELYHGTQNVNSGIVSLQLSLPAPQGPDALFRSKVNGIVPRTQNVNSGIIFHQLSLTASPRKGAHGCCWWGSYPCLSLFGRSVLVSPGIFFRTRIDGCESRTQNVNLGIVGQSDGGRSFTPHGQVRPFHQKPNGFTQSTVGPHVVQIWSRNTSKCTGNEIRVLHRVARL